MSELTFFQKIFCDENEVSRYSQQNAKIIKKDVQDNFEKIDYAPENTIKLEKFKQDSEFDQFNIKYNETFMNDVNILNDNLVFNVPVDSIDDDEFTKLEAQTASQSYEVSLQMIEKLKMNGKNKKEEEFLNYQNKPEETNIDIPLI